MCTQLTPFNTIWMEFYIVYPLYPIDSFQDHLTRFLHCIPNWLLSRPYDLIFVLCTQLTPFKTIWPNFINVLCTYFYQCVTNWLFQHHMTWFLHCLHKWLLSRPVDLILSICTQLTPFKTKWHDFYIVYLLLSMCTQLTPFKTKWPDFYIVYLLLSMCTQLTLFNTIWPDFCIVYTNDSFQDHLT